MGVSEIVECPLCGYKVGKPGLGSHKDSRRCRAHQGMNEMQDKGYAKVPSKKLANHLDRLGIDVEQAPTGYHPGRMYYRKTSEIKYGDWAPEDEIEKHKNEVLSGSAHMRWERIDQTEELLVLASERCLYSYDFLNKPEIEVFKKDEKGTTRKRIFYISDNCVYDSEQFKFGERCERDDPEIDSIIVRWTLKLSQ